MSEGTVIRDTFLTNLGGRVKAIRRSKKLSRRRVAEISDVSQRFLSQFEAGEGNISVARLHSLCEALGVSLDSVMTEPHPDSRVQQIKVALEQASHSQLEMIADILHLDSAHRASRRRIALIGLPGAGKSTLGTRLARDLKYELIDLDHRVKMLANEVLPAVDSLYGQEAYRRIERETLERLASSGKNIVIVTDGDLVTHKATYRYLLSRYLTIWVCTTPEQHVNRAVASDSHHCNEEKPPASFRSIVEQRHALYAQAQLMIDTSYRSLEECSAELLDAILSYR